CQNKKCDRPKEEMLDTPTLLALLEDGTAVAAKLLDIAKGGIRFVGFKNAQVSELAATISSIVAENNYLKRLLGIFRPAEITADEHGAKISFGPRNEYTLFIPAVTQSARTKVANSLKAAAEDLQKASPAVPEQKWLPFVDCA
ncbi:MAG: hypothetical protein EBT15_08575, partial [Betaproteobacteria bacterium]|nr:hypothetical protein [Betaproteobacteria bacterium]